MKLLGKVALGWAAASAIVACSEKEPRGTAAGVAVDATLDVDGDGSITADDPGPRVTPDAAPGDAAPLAGTFGAPCTQKSQCDAGYCLETRLGKRCSKTCKDDASCPVGFRCRQDETAADVVSVCVDGTAKLCAPCNDDGDCKVAGATGKCVSYGLARGSFCGVPCGAGDPCPAGYFCAQESAGKGGQCVRVPDPTPFGQASLPGTCACPALAAKEGQSTACVQAKTVDGKAYCCPGKNACQTNGTLSGCEGKDCKPCGWEPSAEGKPCAPDLDTACLKHVWKDAACIPKPDPLCECHLPDLVTQDGDACNGKEICDTSSYPWKIAHAGATTCTPAASPCQVAACNPATGKCELASVATGTACDDGLEFTEGDHCSGGKCESGTVVAGCLTDADCAPQEDDDKCNGVLYCDRPPTKPPKEWACKANPKTVVQCGTAKDGACTKNQCVPATGQCQLQPVKDGTACDDGEACTKTETCQQGACKAALQDQLGCCTSDAGCQKFDDGDLCNGTLFCDVETGKCLVNPATIPTPCPTVDDSECLQKKCQPKTGQCAFVPLPDGATCSGDGSTCAAVKACQQGVCVASGIQCTCKQDADCAKQEDADLCNGKLFCNLVLGKCQTNPATVVHCAGGSTACTTSACEPASGKCVAMPKPDGTKCDADGFACTPVDTCKAGKCTPDTLVCPCVADADCAAKEDGDLCNGTLYCDKATNQCKVNPKTVKSCPSVFDTPCRKMQCQPQTGGCALEDVADGTACSDGDACTSGEACAKGACGGGVFTCDCLTDAHCQKFENGDSCDGTLYCNKAEHKCLLNPGTIVICQTGQDGPCAKTACEPKTGKCQQNAAGTGFACNDNDPCTLDDTCKDVACVGGKPFNCDDGNKCTNEACDKQKGCVFMAQAATCSDGNACTVGETCQGTSCGATTAQALVCDDGNVCTTDACAPKTGCAHVPVADGTACDDGSACTAGDGCVGGKCGAGKAMLWSSSLDGGSSDYGVAACALGSDIAFAGHLSGQGWVRRATADGSKVWEATYPGGSGSGINDVQPMGSGLIAVGWGTYAGNGMDGRLLRLDGNGTVLGEKTFGGTSADGFSHVAVYANGLAIVGTNGSKDKGSKRAWLVLTDLAGAVLFDRVFAAGTEGVGVTWTAEGAAVSGSAGPDTPSPAIWAARTDAKGNTLWARTYASGKGVEGDGIAMVGDGFVITGAAHDPKSGKNRPWLGRLDGAGNLMWQTFVGAPDGGGYLRRAVPAGGHIVVAGAVYAGGVGHGLLGAVDASGNVAWTRLLSDGIYESVNGVAAVPGGWAAAGVTRKDGNASIDLTMVRTDAFGNVQCSGAGACAGKAVDGCDDKLACTADACDDGKGCLHDPMKDGSDCDDGVVCTLGATCKEGKCVSTGPALFHAAFGGSADDAALAAVALPDGFALAGMTFATDIPGGTKSAGAADALLLRTDAAGNLLWSKTFGGSEWEFVYAIVTAAGGFALAGFTKSPQLPGGAKPPVAEDFWLVRTDGGGALSWNKTYGGSNNEDARALVALPDGFALAGRTGSSDLPGGSATAGSWDCWLVRTDAGGNHTWNKTIGGGGDDMCQALVALPDGFALAGATGTNSAGANDAWLVRTDANGGKLWDRHFGGSGEDSASGVVALNDGFVLAGTTASKGKAGYNAWLVRTDAQGNALWERTYGGDGHDYAFGLAALADGFAWIGRTNSATNGGFDLWLGRTDTLGNLLWDRHDGGGGDEAGNALAVLADGFAVVGLRSSKVGDPVDAWLVRTDAFGHASCADAGPCADKPATACDDGNSCTADICDGKSGKCASKPLDDKSACDDANPCTVAATCDQKGNCQAKSQLGTAKPLGDAASLDLFTGIVARPGGLAIASSEFVDGARRARFRLVSDTGTVEADQWVSPGGPVPDKDSGLWHALGLADGSFVAVGHGAGGGWLARFDPAGKLLHATAPFASQADGNSGATSVAQVENGALVVAGRAKIASAWDWWLCNVQLKDYGVGAVGKFPAGVDGATHGPPVVRSWLNGFAVVGGAKVGGKVVSRLLRFDGNGSQNGLPAIEFPAAGDDVAPPFDFAPTPDGGFVIVGDSFAPAGQGWVRRLSSSGAALWHQQMVTAYGSGLNRVALGSDGRIVVGGFIDSAAGVRSAVVASFSPIGEKQDQHTLAEYSDIRGMAIAAGGSVRVVVVKYASGGTVGKTSTLPLDPWGNPICTTCAGLTPTDCDDSDPKTLDLCSPQQGCVHLPQ